MYEKREFYIQTFKRLHNVRLHKIEFFFCIFFEKIVNNLKLFILKMRKILLNHDINTYVFLFSKRKMVLLRRKYYLLNLFLQNF